MNEVKFNSIEELFNRLKPAFSFKINELKRKNINNVTNKDIWNYFSKTKWSKENNLELCDMVNDIVNLKEYEFLKYINNQNK